MNCKKGDLAIVVNTPPYAQEFLGRIYTCLSLEISDLKHPAWIVDGNVTDKIGRKLRCIEDMFLKPLDAPMDDEEITTDEPVSLYAD